MIFWETVPSEAVSLTTLLGSEVAPAFVRMAATEQTVPETLPEPASNEVSCMKCGQACSLLSGATPKGSGLQCRLCVNVYQVLYRHLGGLPASMQHLSAEEQKTFFRKSADIVKVQPKKGIWKLVRQELKSSLVRYRTQQTRRRVNHEYLPLSAWKARGFDTDLIQEKGEMVTDPAPRL